MSTILVSVGASLAQMMLLMLSAHFMGVAQYTDFSLSTAIAILLSAVASEWLRMILARQAGNPRVRVRSRLLNEIRQVMFSIVGTIIVAGGTTAAAFSLAGFYDLSGKVLAVSILAASSVISDMMATFLRFTAEQRLFGAFSLGRVLVTGVATVTAAALTQNGLASVYAFALANLVVGAVVTGVLWPFPRKWIRIRLLRRFIKVGAAMATSFVAVTWETKC